jgi:hypothetical protein
MSAGLDLKCLGEEPLRLSPPSAAQKGVWPLRGPSHSLSPSLSPIVGMNKYVLIDRYVISISKDVKSVEDGTQHKDTAALCALRSALCAHFLWLHQRREVGGAPSAKTTG